MLSREGRDLSPEHAEVVRQNILILKDSFDLPRLEDLLKKSKSTIFEKLNGDSITRKWFRTAMLSVQKHAANQRSPHYEALQNETLKQAIEALQGVLREIAPALTAADPTTTSPNSPATAIHRGADLPNAFDYKMKQRPDLAAVAKQYYKDVDQLGAFPLVGRSDWLPEQLVELARVDGLKRQASPNPPSARWFHPSFLDAGETCESWSKKHNPKMQITDDVSYRLMGIDTSQGPNAPILTFARSSYFNYYNTCEAIAFELADWRVGNMQSASPPPERLPARGAPGDVWNLERRNAVAGLNALFILHGLPGLNTVFLVHEREQRGEAQLAEAQNTLHVVPAGTFQPDGYKGGLERDFSMSRSIVRELAEELLGQKEVEEQTRMGRDFLNEPAVTPYRDALRDGGVKIFYLGTAFDPVTIKPEVMLVVVADAKALEVACCSQFERNWEGEPVVFDWTTEWLDEHASSPNTLPAGAACMQRVRHFFPQIESVIRDQVAART